MPVNKGKNTLKRPRKGTMSVAKQCFIQPNKPSTR